MKRRQQKSGGTPKKQKSGGADAKSNRTSRITQRASPLVPSYQRQSTLVAALRDEDADDVSEAMQLRAHHRNDVRYAKPKSKPKRKAKTASVAKKAALLKPTPRKKSVARKSVVVNRERCVCVLFYFNHII